LTHLSDIGGHSHAVVIHEHLESDENGEADYRFWQNEAAYLLPR